MTATTAATNHGDHGDFGNDDDDDDDDDDVLSSLSLHHGSRVAGSMPLVCDIIN